MPTNRIPYPLHKRSVQRGLTLIELMIALVLGLLLVIAMSAVFVSSSMSRREVQMSADVIENGRYGIDILNRELTQAGFYGTLANPAGTLNDMCSTITAGAPANWRDSLLIHASGLNNTDANPACLTRKAGTDAIFIQRASTCRLGETGCGAEVPTTQAYIQVSSCGTEYSTTPYVVDLGGASTFTLKGKDCTSVSTEKRRLVRRVYFISTNDELRSMDITPAGAQTPVTLVEGIEQMQIEYAIDGSGDGSVDTFTSTPTAAEWPNVIGVRLWLLAKSTETSRNAAAAMTFTMGDCTYTTANSACNTVPSSTPTTPQLKRRVYNTFISFATPKLRRES
jgi:type IV pilus assembly protein PilW